MFFFIFFLNQEFDEGFISGVIGSRPETDAFWASRAVRSEGDENKTRRVAKGRSQHLAGDDGVAAPCVTSPAVSAEAL